MFDIFLCIWYTIFMKKDMFTINKNGLSYGRGYVYSLQYLHIPQELRIRSRGTERHSASN